MNKYSSVFWVLLLLFSTILLACKGEGTDNSNQHSMVSNSLPIQLIWTYSSKEHIRKIPTGNSDSVFLLVGDRNIIALDNETGEQKWVFENDKSFSPGANLAVTEELVIGSINDDKLVSLIADTGEVLWETSISENLTRAPNLIIIDDTVIIAQRNETAYVAGYSVRNGERNWNLSSELAYTGISGLIDCPGIKVGVLGKPVDDAACIIFHETVYVVDPRQGKVIDELTSPFSLFREPYFKKNFFFSSTNETPKSEVSVYDHNTDSDFQLFPICVENKLAKPVTAFESLVLIGNGCDQIYTLAFDNLQTTPKWVVESSNAINSSFTSIYGDYGYFINSDAKIIGVDLLSGDIVGEFITEPNNLANDRFDLDGLNSNPPYLYAVMDEVNLFVFK